MQIILDVMGKYNQDFLLLNTTNEFLVEYNSLAENSLYKLTGFSGSTGKALVTKDKVFLFVDGRYHIQADLEVNHDFVKVVKLASWKDFLPELDKIIQKKTRLSVFSKKISLAEFRNLEKYYSLKCIDNDPFDEIENFSHNSISDNEHISETYTTSKKAADIMNSPNFHLSKDEVFYITDINDISYLFNIRNYSREYSAQVLGRGLLYDGKCKFFPPEQFSELRQELQELSRKVVVDTNSINMYDYNFLINANIQVIENKENPIPYLRATKSETEIENLKKAFSKTDIAINAVRDYIYSQAENISEYDIAKKLQEEFFKQGAKGLSFKPIVARNKNSALAHYSKSSKTETVSDGDLILIDCGAYFDGGLATDITRVFVKGQPNHLQKKIYTLVLKAFLKAFNYYKDKRDVSGFEIDFSVREFFKNTECDGFTFNHGLGHGLGINVHEAPPSLSNATVAQKYKLRNRNCFTIEPGLYKEGLFGIRLENSCYIANNKIFSFSKMNFEDKLIDYSMLNSIEQEQLLDFEVK